MITNKFIKILACLMIFSSATTFADEKIDAATVADLKQSIVDEIYANNIQSEFLDVGEPISETKRKLRIYVQPKLQKGRGWVIYKLMPVGEVYRMFTPSKDVGVLLYGEIDNGFPPTQPSYKTVYMSDDKLDNFKKDWLKEYIEIDLSPNKLEVQNAKLRQQKRYPES